jgi:hypothetical protein
MTNQDPTIPAYIERDEVTGSLYAYVKCPHCGDMHSHGAGQGDSPPILGNRLSHCVTCEPAGYSLVLGPPDMPKPRRKPYRQRLRELEAFDRARGKPPRSTGRKESRL